MPVKNNDKVKEIADFVARNLSENEIKQLKTLLSPKDSIPVSIFQNDLSALQLIVRYLKDEKNYSIQKISEVLDRKKSTIYNTYNASKKLAKLEVLESEYSIPVNILKKTKLSILEKIGEYLVSEHKLSTKEIAKLLNRSYETIKTIRRRARLKS